MRLAFPLCFGKQPCARISSSMVLIMGNIDFYFAIVMEATVEVA